MMTRMFGFFAVCGGMRKGGTSQQEVAAGHGGTVRGNDAAHAPRIPPRNTATTTWNLVLLNMTTPYNDHFHSSGRTQRNPTCDRPESGARLGPMAKEMAMGSSTEVQALFMP
jgi:hypothetical protein